MTTKKNVLPTNLGMNISYINLAVKNKSTCQAILKLFDESFFKTQGTFGSGIMKYIGNWDADNSVFMGGNKNSGAYLLRFEGDTGIKHLDKFRTDFLDKSSNAEHLNNLTMTSAQATLVLKNMATDKSEMNLRSMFERTVQAQQKSTPKVSVVSGELLIGSKTSKIFVRVSGMQQSGVTAENIAVTLKLQDAGADAFFNTLQLSMESRNKDVIANEMYGQLSRITLTDFIEMLRSCIAKEFDIGKVMKANQVRSRNVSKTGQYTRRILVGITNKLMEPDSEETSKILIGWCTDLYNLSSEIQNSETLFKEISSALSGSGASTSPTILPTSLLKRRRTPRVTPSPSPATFEFLNKTTEYAQEKSEGVKPPTASKKRAQSSDT